MEARREEDGDNARGGEPVDAASTLAPVLLVEDDEVHALLIETSLSKARMANPVVRARNGNEAVAYLEDAADGHRGGVPALILLDLELPGRSGLEVLEALIGLAGPSSKCPVIMMSASSESTSIARARALGVRGYLVKPVAFDALADVIHRLGLPWAILGGGGP